MGLFSSVSLALCRQFLRLLKEHHQPECPGFFRITLSGIVSPRSLMPGLAEQRQSHMGVF